jgi:hypothetical protein
MKETRKKKELDRPDRFRPSWPSLARSAPRDGFYAPPARRQPSRACPNFFFPYLFRFFRTYLYSNTNISRYTEIISPETLTRIFEPLNFII